VFLIPSATVSKTHTRAHIVWNTAEFFHGGIQAKQRSILLFRNLF